VKDHRTDTRDVTHDFDRACGNTGDGARNNFRAALSHVDEVWYTCFRPPSNQLLLAVTDEWGRLLGINVSPQRFVIYDATTLCVLVLLADDDKINYWVWDGPAFLDDNPEDAIKRHLTEDSRLYQWNGKVLRAVPRRGDPYEAEKQTAN
jgi:hypothetical protein